MYTVYAIPVSLYCAKLRILLRHKQLEWEEVLPPGGYGSDEYKRIVPSGNLPALVDGDLLIADSEAIAEYLNERHPDPPLLPSDLAARATARERSRFHDTRLEPATRAMFPMIRGGRAAEETVQKLVGEVNRRLSQFTNILNRAAVDRDFGITLGDCGYPVTFCWLDHLSAHSDLDLTWPQEITAYRTWLLDQPAVAAEMADYGPKLAAWMADNAA